MSYVKQWDVENSRGTGTYRVSMDSNGDYECACMAWTRTYPRKDCKHILEIKLKLIEQERSQFAQNFQTPKALVKPKPKPMPVTTGGVARRKFDFD